MPGPVPTSCLLGTVLLLACAVAAEPAPRVAIIVDDLGYQLAAGERALRLPGPVSYAVLPQTPRGPALARLAASRGRDVLLHLPLQPVGEHGNDEPGGISLDMSRLQFRGVFERDLASVPQAIGINNHRGSLLTRHPGHMSWLMQELGPRGLIFVDSYTTHHSVALQIARENGIPATRRDVFLDANPTPAAIAAEFRRLKRLARARGSAIAIAHPYPVTLQFLESELPSLADEGYRLVGIGELLGAGAGAAPQADRTGDR